MKFNGCVFSLLVALSSSVFALPDLPPFPTIPPRAPENTVPMGPIASFPEAQLDLPIAAGPFQPTWTSIEKNYPGSPAWLRNAKFGIWVHFGPQASGESGDWYARKLYVQGTLAYTNHLNKYGPPSQYGYKEVLRDWNPTNLNPAALTQIYKDAGARFLMIQGVHSDNWDNWNSRYNPWNAVNLGPHRDLIAEWTNACRSAGMPFGVTFHNEYTWWWEQTAFGSDSTGPNAGVPYDGNLTLADGVGKWWEGYDPRLLYGVNLREYQGVTAAANSQWSPPPAGIYTNHLPYANWYAKQWALRMMDVVDKYSPDFIYTDGTDQQPFSGSGSGTGYKCDAMQRVIADFYNTTLTRRGKVDTFSIVKFRKKTNGTANTEEGTIPSGIKTDQPWIGEVPVGDWYYAPGFTYSAGMVVHYLLEQVSRDGNVAVCVAPLPDGSLDAGSTQMLQNIGAWMNVNGEGIYGSHAWLKYGEGTKHLPAGSLRSTQANYAFTTSDFRFMVGSNGCLYAYCMTLPSAGSQLTIVSLSTSSNLLKSAIGSVSLLGSTNSLVWSQTAAGLVVTLPATMPSLPSGTGIGLKIGPATAVGSATPTDVTAWPENNQVSLSWGSPSTTATFNVKRSLDGGSTYTVLATNITAMSFADTNVTAGTLYYYKVSSMDFAGESVDSTPASGTPVSAPSTNWLTEDIGAVAATGSFGVTNGVFTIKGSGADIWNSADEFRYAFQALPGDCSITVRVLNMQNTATWAKAGLMIRESLDPASKYVIHYMSPTKGTAMQQRALTTDSATGISNPTGMVAPYWLRLVRSGDTFTAYTSPDGANWTVAGTTTVMMRSNVYVGLEVCSVKDGTLCQAQFDNVSFSTSSVVISSPLPPLIHRWSFNETSGTNAYDSIGGVTGTLNGSAVFDGNGRVVLNGTSGTYVSLSSNLLAGLTNVTIEAWLTNAATPDKVALFSFDNGLQNGVGSGYLRFALRDQTNSRCFMELASSAGSPLLAANPGLGGRSLHLTCVCNPAGGAAFIYTNGVLATAMSVSTALTNVSPAAAALGRSPWSSDPWLNASIDEFRIYAGQLLSSDIAATEAIGPDALLTTNVALNVSLGSGALTLGWPVAGSGFTLESSPVLGAGAVWTPVNSPVSSNNQVVVTATNAAMYFRLRR